MSDFNIPDSERMELLNAIGGNDAVVYITMPDGRRKVFANLIKLNASISYSKTSYPVLGVRVKPFKKGLGEIKGTMTAHYNTSVFREAAREYRRSGTDAFYDLQIVNIDENGKVGAQVIILYGVNFDSIDLALIDSEAEYLTEELAFTANDFDIERAFTDGGLKDA